MAATKLAYAVHGGVVKQDMSQVLAMRGHAQFEITVRHKDIEGTHFGNRYSRLVEANRNKALGAVSPGEPLRYICSYCLPLLARLAPQTSFQGLTLEDLINSPAYDLQIVRTDLPEGTHITGGDQYSYRPAMNMLPLKTVDLPPGCHAVTRFAANQITVDDYEPSRGVQGRVPVAEGRYMYFKPREAGREKQFDREIQILNDIKTKDLVQGEVKLSELQGIVMSGEGEEKCIGVLLNMISNSSFGTDLLSPGCWTHGEMHEKWERQVTATVEVLHTHGLVWGDVNAGNVVIDEAFDAWVIDLGGMNNPEFVDDDKAETVEGDWQGVSRLFQKWLASCRAGVPL